MKLIGIKKIFVKINGRNKPPKKSFKVTWICNLLKKSSSTIRPQVQSTQLALAPTETKFRKSLKNPFKLLLRHLNITKFENEDQVVQYCDREEVHRKLKKYDEAINDLDYAIALEPYKSTAWRLRGIIRGLKKSYIDPFDDLYNALTINCLALKCRAFCYYMLKSYDQSLWNLNVVIILGYTDAFTHINRADTNRELKIFKASKDLAYGTHGVLNGKYRAAVDDLTKELELQPNNAMFLRNCSGAYKILIYPEALEDLEKSCILKPERGAIYLDMCRWYDSLKNLNKAVELHPNKASSIGNRAEFYCKLRKYDLAIEDVNQAFKLEPKNVIAHQQLTNIYRRKCRHKEEISFALSLDPKNINTLLFRADICFLLEKYNESFMDLDNVIRIVPRNSYTLTLYLKLKRYDNALNDINAALRIKATNIYALEVCEEIYKKQQKYQDALDNFNKSLELYPLKQNQYQYQYRSQNRGDDDDKLLKLIQRNTLGYDGGLAITQQTQGERNFSIYFKRGNTYSKLEMFKAALHKLKGLDDALMDINKYLKVHPRCFKSLELREGILNDIKKRNLEQEAVSKSSKSSKSSKPSALITDATSKVSMLPLSKVPNFGDTYEERDVCNLLSEIGKRVEILKKCREQKELQNKNANISNTTM
ncbi:hypothetical protein Glove_9g306 [Diversispora epigaea]|uniref:Uncharacterized protein n=1 Tax=Diversispora epigaea TaxID=1348612 RepID=A0A397JYT3_9GLOM|nr:hypothetical protein Glove_9g306 [Diversispora epigaea]